MQKRKVLVTGGLGFIGLTLVEQLLINGYSVLNLDKITYASNVRYNKRLAKFDTYTFKCVDISKYDDLLQITSNYQPNIVVHCAAESHVDKSIDGPAPFVQSNIIGTFQLLEVIRSGSLKNFEKLIHVSTDEVFGHLGENGLFSLESPYKPNSPYSASKASSDLLVRAWTNTYKIPCLITNCSNNYGPYQHTEKMIPKTIINILKNKSVTIYGDGSNVRNWLFVEDHVECLIKLFDYNGPIRQFLIGSEIELDNNKLVRLIFEKLKSRNKCLEIDVEYVDDRPAHDFRYSIDYSETTKQIGWVPKTSFDMALEKTIDYYQSIFEKN